MHVEIHDGNAGQPVMVQRIFYGNSDGAEQAEAHCSGGLGVVAGWAACDESVFQIARQYGIHRSTGPTDRAQGGIERSGGKGGGGGGGGEKKGGGWQRRICAVSGPGAARKAGERGARPRLDRSKAGH